MTPQLSRWQKLRRTGHVGWQVNPLDLVRRKLTSGLEVTADRSEARRGEQIEARVTVAEPEQLGDVEVGLVCTEYYDVLVPSAGGEHSSSQRSTAEATEYETWLPVPAVQGEHSVRLTIPPQAPFSYQGTCLSFRWEIVARGRRRGLDAQARPELGVRP